MEFGKNLMAFKTELVSFFNVVGFVIVLWGVLCLTKIHEARSWPTVDGKVISCQINSHQSRRNGQMYDPVIQFIYAIHGRSYLASKDFLGEYDNSSFSDAQRMIDKYPLNKEVVVHYNPNKPQEAILDFNRSRCYYTLCFGGFFILIGILVKLKIIPD